MFKKKGLAFRLSAYLLSVGFVVLFAILYYNYIISRSLVLQDAKNDAEKLTELTVSRIENVLQNVENIPTNLAWVIENRDTIRFVSARNVIKEVLQKYPLLFGACIASAPRIEGGDTIYSAPYVYESGDTVVFKDLGEDKLYDYPSQPWYTEAKELGKGIWSEPYYDLGGGDHLMATYSVPFYRDRGNGPVFGGVVTADISLSGLQELIRGIQFYETGYGFLISSTGNIVTWPKIDSADNQFVQNIFDEVEAPGMIEVLKRMISGEKGIVSLSEIGANKNRDHWISYASMPSTRWSLGILFKETELYKGIHTLYYKLIAIGFAGFLVLGFLIFYISRRFVQPIEKLAFATRRIGAGDFDFKIPSFKANDEISQLGKSFDIMQVQLQEYIANLKETTAQKERMESELEIASTIQQQMLPMPRPIPGWEKIKYFGLLQPARQVGGDLYDFIVRDDQLYFAVGDVSGKGIPAALFMAKTLTLFRAKVGGGLSTEEIAGEINRDLSQYNAQSMFVTFFIGMLDMNSGELTYTNAGHNLPLILKAGQAAKALKGTHGIPLGSMAGVNFSHGKLTMHRGEKIILYTDGITEAVNTDEQLYGEARLEGLVQGYGVRSPEDIAGLILADVKAFAGETEQADDITMLILEYN